MGFTVFASPPPPIEIMLATFLQLYYTSFLLTLAEDTNQSTNKIRKRRQKKRYAQGALSDHEVRYRTTKRNENIFAKATKSDTKLLTNVNKNPVTKRLVRISNSMNDLSVIKTPKNDASSVEDLQTIEDDEGKRPRQRQRSSSLDMGRG